MVRFWKVVNEVLKKSDIILEVVDARYPDLSRNIEIEGKMKSAKKDMIIIFNKSDLVPMRKRIKPKDVKYCVYTSATKNLGTSKLRNMIRKLSKKDEVTTLGIVGYPNSGKSSLINVLRQKKVAKTSSTAGYTKGIQKIRLSQGVYLLDTPGVYAYREKDEWKLVLIGAKSCNTVKDPETVAMMLLGMVKRKAFRETYGINYKVDVDELIDNLAEKLKYYSKGKLLNRDKTCRKIIRDWQAGILTER